MLVALIAVVVGVAVTLFGSNLSSGWNALATQRNYLVCCRLIFPSGAASPRPSPPSSIMSLLVQFLIPAVAAGLFLIAAYGDIRTRRIPNALALAVAVLGLVRLVLAGDPAAALLSIAAAAAVFAIGFLLFWRGWLGGGDVKLMAAAILLVGAPAVSLFLIAMSLVGLVVTLATLAADRLARRPATPNSAPEGEPGSRRTVPYGVAIAAGAILTLAVQLSVSG